MPQTSNVDRTSLSRREMLQRAGMGLGTLALVSLLHEEGLLEGEARAAAGPPLTPGKAKSVIFLFMGGGPSQVDTFDPKPLLRELHGGSVPDSIARGIPRIARAPLNDLFASPYRFHRCGQSGIPVSEIFPNIGRCVDDLC